MPWSAVAVLLIWRQPFASRVARIAAARLSTSIRPRYTSRAAFTVGDSMTVDLLGTYVRPLGTGMSSNALRGGLDDVVAHPAASASTNTAATALCTLMRIVGSTRLALLCPRQNFDPHLWARRSGRIVSPRTRTVVPVRLRRLIRDDRRRLDDDLRRRWRRVIPPRTRTPPECRTNHDDTVSTDGAVVEPG